MEKRAAYIGLAILSLVWGYNWVVMKVALRYCGPLTFAALRCLAGGAALWAVLPLLGRPLVPKHWGGAFILGLLQSTCFIGISSWALVHGGAGKTAVLVYTMPFWLALMALAFFRERIEGLQWSSIALGFLGLALVIQPWRLRSPLFSVGLAVGAGFIWALSGIWAMRLNRGQKDDLLTLNAWQSLLGGIPLLAAAFWAGERSVNWTPAFMGAVVYNAVPVTALSWALWLFALRELPAGRAGMSTLLTPIIGVIMAWLQLGEAPGVCEASGMALIFAGLALLIWDQLRVWGNKDWRIDTLSESQPDVR